MSTYTERFDDSTLTHVTREGDKVSVDQRMPGFGTTLLFYEDGPSGPTVALDVAKGLIDVLCRMGYGAELSDRILRAHGRGQVPAPRVVTDPVTSLVYAFQPDGTFTRTNGTGTMIVAASSPIATRLLDAMRASA